MNRLRYATAAAAVIISVSAVSVQSAEAVQPTRAHVALSPTRSWVWPVNIRALIAHILKQECEAFPVLCRVVVPPTTTVPPPTTVTTAPPTTVSPVPPTTVITLPIVNVSIPVPVVIPASSVSGSSCVVTMTGGGVSQCTQSASVSSSG